MHIGPIIAALTIDPQKILKQVTQDPERYLSGFVFNFQNRDCGSGQHNPSLGRERHGLDKRAEQPTGGGNQLYGLLRALERSHNGPCEQPAHHVEHRLESLYSLRSEVKYHDLGNSWSGTTMSLVVFVPRSLRSSRAIKRRLQSSFLLPVKQNHDASVIFITIECFTFALNKTFFLFAGRETC